MEGETVGIPTLMVDWLRANGMSALWLLCIYVNGSVAATNTSLTLYASRLKSIWRRFLLPLWD